MFSKLENKKYIILILILILGLILRFQELNKPFQRDETRFVETIKNTNELGKPIYNLNSIDLETETTGKNITIFDHHPPLYIFFLNIFSKIFGYNEVALRFSMVFFSMVSIILVYLLGKNLFGEEYGLLSSFILAISRLHVEYSQQIDIDGSFLTFFFLLSALYFINFLKLNKKNYIFLLILSLSLSILTKITSFILIFSIFFILIRYRKKYILKIFVPVFVINLIFLFYFSYFYSVNYFFGPIKHVIKYSTTKSGDIFFKFYEFVGIFTWDFTIPLILLSVLSIYYFLKKKEPSYKFILYFTLFYTSANIVILGIMRYFIPIVPFLSLMTSKFVIDNLNLKKHFKLIILTSSIIIIFFHLLHIRTDVDFLKNIKDNIFYISIPYTISLFPFIFVKNKKYFLIVLFSLYIGYNIYFSIESINPIYSPRFYNSIYIARDLIRSLPSNSIIITSHDIAYYSGINFYQSDTFLIYEKFVKVLSKNHPVYILDYRTNSFMKPETMKYLENNCTKIGFYEDRKIEIIKIFRC